MTIKNIPETWPVFQSQSPNKPHQITALTGLRFIAAIMVLIAHATVRLTSIKLVLALLTGWASIGMTTFFVLSGFVMWINYTPLFHRQKFGAALWEFCVARFARLYPLYILIILLGIVIYPREALQDTLPAFALFFVGIQSLIPSYGNQVLALVSPAIGHLWSISVEMVFYIFFPLIAFVFFKVKSPARILWLLALTLLLHYYFFHYSRYFVPVIGRLVAPALSEGDLNQWVMAISPFRYILDFVAGCLTAALFEKSLHLRQNSKHDGFFCFSLLTIFSSIGTYVYGCYFQVGRSWMEVVQCCAPLAALSYILFYIALFKGRTTAFLSLPFIVLGGEVSYSIYMLHPFLLDLLPQGLISQHSFRAALLLLLSFIIISSFTIFFAYGTYWAVEVPCRIWLRHNLSQRKTAKTLTTAIAVPIMVIMFAGITHFSHYPHHATRMADLISIRDAFESYHRDHGSYPLSKNSQADIDWIGIGWGNIGDTWLPGIVPAYLPIAPRDPRMTDISHAQYIWKSDGQNYKIISMNPEDCEYTIKNDASLSDVRRNTEKICMSYGYWSPGAIDW